jgi:putative membrane protein
MRMPAAAVATLVALASLGFVATAESFNRPAAPAELDDPTIVAIFDAANMADIETGQLAKKLRVTPTPPRDDWSAEAHAKAVGSLRAKTGPDFDRAFLQHEAAFHKSVIDAVKNTLLPAIRNEELRALVVKVAPAFQAHMVAAQNLEKKLAGASTR